MLLLPPAPPGAVTPPEGVTVEFDAEENRSYWCRSTIDSNLRHVVRGEQCWCCVFCQLAICNPNVVQECFGGCTV